MKAMNFLNNIPILVVLFAATTFVFVDASSAQRPQRGGLPSSKVEPEAAPTEPDDNANPASGAELFDDVGAQPEGNRPTQAMATQPTANVDSENLTPEPVNDVVEVLTDKVLMAYTWFPAGSGETAPGATASSGKDAAAFLLLHDWDSQRSDMFPLARHLQSAGYAVLVPDLRGHGESTRVTGSDQTLDFDKFKPAQIASAINDIEQCRRILLAKNDAEEVNIDLLNVVAVGDSAHLAVQWAITDWSWKPIGGKKQGQYVKSLTLVSPTARFKRSSLTKLARAPVISGANGTAIPMFLIWGGQDPEAAEDGQDLYDLLSKDRPPSSASDPAAVWREQDLFQATPNVPMNGTQLIAAPPIQNSISNFAAQKVLTARERFKWEKRGK